MTKLLWLFFFFFSNLVVAAVSVQVEDIQLQSGQGVRLILTMEGDQRAAIPDLAPLQQNFVILGTERSMSYSIVNGQANSISQWTILLQPKKNRPLTIPSLQVGQEKTEPKTLELNTEQAPQGSGSDQEAKELKLIAEVSETSPFINQQIIYTVKLYNRSRLIDAQYQVPEVDDALLIPLGEGKRYQTNEQGTIYTVDEQQYAIFPQKSGELKIKAPRFTALIYDSVPRRVSLEAEKSQVQVKPIPLQYQNKPWLPAKAVHLSEGYDKEASVMGVGSTLVRTVAIEALGAPAQLLPALDFSKSPQFSLYPEKAVETNSLRQQNLLGTSTIKVTYLLNQAGKIKIPALNLVWFNIQTGQEEMSNLPERTIEVIAANQSSQNNKSTSLPDKHVSSPTNPPKTPEPVQPLIKEQANPLAWWIAAAFASLWLLTLAFGHWSRRRPNSKPAAKTIYQNLEKACLANQSTQGRDALLAWARWQWPDKKILSLLDVERLVSEPNSQQKINELAQALYQDKQEAWQGKALWQVIKTFKKPDDKKSKNSDPLPPINRL